MKHAAVNLDNKYKFGGNSSVFTKDRFWTDRQNEAMNIVVLG